MAIYLDNAATSFPKAPGVSRAVAHYLDDVGANLARSSYASATDCANIALETRRRLCALFSFGDPSHVIFTPGATHSLNYILKGWLRPGDRCIYTQMEHNAVLRPLHQLAQQGVTTQAVPCSAEGLPDLAAFARLLPGARLVVVTHASNVCGAVLPLEEMCALAAAQGVPLVADCAQTAGHMPVRFGGLSALVFAGHKGLLGPAGTGGMLLSAEFARALAPLVAGGTGSLSDVLDPPPYLPDKFEAGTLNLPGIYGLHAALGYLLARGVDDIFQHEQALTQLFVREISGLPVRVLAARAPARAGVISLDFWPRDNAEAAFRLESEFGILTRAGLHCAPLAHRALGSYPQGSVRFSFGAFTTANDVRSATRAVAVVTGR